jgi:hypothetical protein
VKRQLAAPDFARNVMKVMQAFVMVMPAADSEWWG